MGGELLFLEERGSHLPLINLSLSEAGTQDSTPRELERGRKAGVGWEGAGAIGQGGVASIEIRDPDSYPISPL